MLISPSNYQIFFVLLEEMLTLESANTLRIARRYCHRLVLLVHTTNVANRTFFQSVTTEIDDCYSY